jgi:2-keto-3-deoxy-L-rhamnonate aldolase
MPLIQMAALPPPPGVYVPVPTFFVSRSDPQYNAAAAPLDLKTQAKHSIHLAKCGIRGLVILGSTGEAVALTNPERSLLLSSVRKELEVAGFMDYPIIAGTATQSIAETVQQLVEAKETGAQWGLCLAPGYFAGAVTQEGLIRWYSAVADQSPIPIMMWVISCLLPVPFFSRIFRCFSEL